MKKLLTIISLLFSFIALSQNCPDLGPNQFLPCGVGSTVLTANLSSCVAGTNPNQTTSYSVSSIPYVAQANIPVPPGSQIFMTDDSQQGSFPIGFTFCFYGNTYNQFYIGSNGWISFSGAQPTTFTSNSIPTTNPLVPKNCIMGPWQDWHPGLGGTIKYQTTGIAPCRKLTVSWTNVPMFSCTGNQGTFHIVIYESTNIIENYIQNKPACLTWQGGTATEGVHNLAGTLATTVPGRNSTAWTATNEAWKWSPSGPVVSPVLTWYLVGNPIPIGTGPSITVTPPPAGANYTCHFVYPTCNTGWSTCNAVVGPGPDTVFVQPGPPNLLPANMVFTNPLCFGGCDGTATANPVSGIPIYTYLWSNSQTTQTITNLCPGVYSVLITDGAGCSVVSTVTLTNPPMIVAGPINYSDTICFNSTNEVYTVPNLGPGYTYTWSSVGSITYGQGTDSINVDWTGVSSGYTPTGVMVTAIDANGCTSLPVSIDLEILNILPTITPIGPLCSNDPCVNLDGSPLGGVFSGTGVVGNQFCPDQSVLSNNINYTYIQSGCAFDTTINVIVNIQPVITSISPDNNFFELCEGDSIPQVYVPTSNIPGTFEWNTNGDTITSNNLYYYWNQIGIFIIQVTETSIDGCISDPSQTSIIIERCPQSLIYIPNSFTPDGDEHNNIWIPIMTSGFDPFDYNLTIMNRWGETIFESNDPTKGWDGSYNGKMCELGIYVYKIRYGLPESDGVKQIYGHINLLK